ncbi:MAG: hypothetical protein IJC09_05105 [Clostridia bacterium]|nr:hypothetical protein [Clostridia bacterium]
MKELKFEELSVKQKLGMVMCGLIPAENRTEENDEYVLDLIRNHCLGAVWVNHKTKDVEKIMARIKEAADYPILILTDAESGMGDYIIGKHNNLGMADSEELAYAFGKITAIEARKMGYNVVCNPILDIKNYCAICGTNIRAIGSDKYRVAELAKAEAQGMHDGGVLTVGKHYPSPNKKPEGRIIDSHMAEAVGYETEEELIENCLYAYKELSDAGVLDGIMTAHTRMINIDDKYPTSLSKKVISLIREQGFDGFIITDALSMMGVVAKFGLTDPKGMCIEAGNDLSLCWTSKTWEGFDAICDCYERGLISDERLDEATKKVLEMHHRVMELEPKFDDLTDEDIAQFERLGTDSIYAKIDDGINPAISKDGKHYFIVLTGNGTQINEAGKVDVATFAGNIWHGGWYDTSRILGKITDMFPNSEAVAIEEYPSPNYVQKTLQDAAKYDDVILITYQDAQAYAGRECLTARIVSMVDCMQVTDSVSAVVHFGNPYVLEDLVHIPRIIVGPTSRGGVDAAFEVLVGNYPAKGKLTYDVKFE